MGGETLGLSADPEAAIAEIRAASERRPVFVFKKSPRCEISLAAERAWRRFLDSPAADGVVVAEVDVIAERPLARGLTAALGIEHASPQALLFHRGGLVWVESHSALTLAAFTAARAKVPAAAPAPPPSNGSSDVLAILGRCRASAILRTKHPDAVIPAMEAAVRGGFEVVEFTLNTPGALDAVRSFADRRGVVVGAGTVLEVADARKALDAGARFLVSPVVDPEVIRFAVTAGVPIIPGCATPTEMLLAYRAGAPLQKLFPGPQDGPSWVRMTLGPLPFLKIVPTSGVDPSNAARYLDAGAFAVGFVASLFPNDDLEAGRFDRIEERARTCVAAVAAAPARR